MYKDKVNKQFLKQLIYKFDNILTFCTVLLSEIKITSNPYTIAKIVQIIYCINLTNENIVKECFKINEIAKQNIVYGLVNFFIDIEFTGDHNQFYLKYEYRHYVQAIFKIIFKIDSYKKSLIKIKDSERLKFQLLCDLKQRFAKFINLLMNDITRCIDDGFDAVIKAKNIKDKKQSGEQLSEEDQKSMNSFERTANACFSNATESINLMAELSGWTPHSFLTSIFAARVAVLLNNILYQLFSENILALQFQYEYKELAKKLNYKQILQNFNEDFCKAIVNDERCYKTELFETAAKKAFRMGVYYDKCEQFSLLTHKLKVLYDNKQDEYQIDDYPEEFGCPLSGDLMEDPVQLPVSKQIVDRRMIEQHLLNDEFDPYSKAPLKKEDLIPCPELKKKIQEWRKAQFEKIKGNTVVDAQSPDKNSGTDFSSTMPLKDNFLNKLE